ncbi:hypothetical protein DTL42_20860 [Bremerella cremea]|uniref:Uncharacterized protein n=1 Tax=Bremerella cremea TaxID=1031537 RepID=A0A368KK29_9BACT|nr:hypothetical protein [Bremerella cremea]RCS41044.1 hypothetical protein DTL42_20860 [Bremerella cremea]
MPEPNSLVPEVKAPTERPPRQFQFSLGGMIVFLLVICLIGSHLRTSWLLYDANQTLKRYRTEFGHLSIQDPSRTYVLAVDPHQELTWQWRVYIPPGQKHELCSIFRDIPVIEHEPDDLAFPKQRSSHQPIDDGELLITTSIQRDGQDRWRFHQVIQYAQGKRTDTYWVVRDKDMAPIISDETFNRVRGAVAGTSQMAFDGGNNVLLLKLQALPPMTTVTDDKNAGLMFWLSPIDP